MTQMVGTQAIQNLLVASFAVAELIAVKAVDGLNAQDFAEIAAKIVEDEALRNKVIATVKTASELPQEITDLDTLEVISLVSSVLPLAMDLVIKIKAAKAAQG